MLQCTHTHRVTVERRSKPYNLPMGKYKTIVIQCWQEGEVITADDGTGTLHVLCEQHRKEWLR